MAGKVLQPQTLCDLLNQANNSGLVSRISTPFKTDTKKAMNALGYARTSLNVVNSRKISNLVSGSPMHLIEEGQLKPYKKLKTSYGHYSIEDGLQQPQEVNCLCIDKAGRFAYTGSDDGLVKCWYLMTGQLIDSLRCFHPITDLTVSPDNVYLAAGTLIGELRFWSREKLAKICTFSLGSSSINHIKWWNTPNALYVLACSDKSIFIYSLKDIVEKRHLAAYLCLNTPVETFSLGINEQGFLAAGLNTGKVIFWKLSKSSDKKRLTETYLFDLQENQKKTYLMEWSPIAPLVIAGSLEGKMVITRVSGLSYECKLSIELKDKYISKTGVCNAISWSARGKYAIGALTGKPKAHPKKRVTTLVVWDSVEEKHWTIPKGDEFELAGNLLGLSVHPQLESVVVCGGSSGLIYLINIESGEILQSFRETGVWSHSSDVDADIIDCAFASSGLQFVVTTSVGTVGFYGTLAVERFQATPVEQFFKADYAQETDDGPQETSKKVCNARLIEYSHQVPLPEAEDKNYLERLKFFKKELETYSQLETELLKDHPDGIEERKFVIDDEELKQGELQEASESEHEHEDEDYIEDENEDESLRESEEEDYLSGMSDEDDLIRKARRRRKKQRRIRRYNHEEARNNGMREVEEYNNYEESKGQYEEELKEEIKEREEGEYYIDIEEETIPPIDAICEFCNKMEGKVTMLGPYVLLRDSDKTKIDGKALWIHKDCLENNDFLRLENGVFIGIREFLEKSVTSRIECNRCKKRGCTIKCTNCNKWFHGYSCSSVSGVFIEDSNVKNAFKYYCYNCYGNLLISISKNNLSKNSSLKICAKLSRDWLLRTESNSKSYIPQIYDECYYFFQGHELFLKENIHHLCRTASTGCPELPWKKYPELIPGPALCYILEISYEFPDVPLIHSNRQEFKLDYPPVLMRIKLLIDGTNKSFELLYLNTTGTSFLVLRETYEESKNWFKAQWKQLRDMLSVRTETNLVTHVVGIEDVEEDTFRNTEWRNIVVRQEFEDQGIRLRSKKSEAELIKISYWDLANLKIEQRLSKKVARDIQDIIEEKIKENEGLYALFVDNPCGIENYLNIIACPMFYNLICMRLQNGYYRRIESIAHDIKLIVDNARTFNWQYNPDIVNDAEDGSLKILGDILDYALSKNIKVLDELFDGIDLSALKFNAPQIEIIDGVSITIPKELLELPRNKVEIRREVRKTKPPKKILKKLREKKKRMEEESEGSDESYKESEDDF